MIFLKRTSITVLFFSFFYLQCDAQDLIKYVQPMAGTASATTASAKKHGSVEANYANTIPAVTLPFAMTQWTPQTQGTETKCVAPYYYKDSFFNGFRASHWLSGSCTQDYGSFTIMPISGKLKTLVKDYQTKISHDKESSSPSEYQIIIDNYGLQASMTSTLRASIMRFKALKADSVYLLITPNSDYKEGYVKIDQLKGEVVGYNPVHRIYQGWGKKAGFSGYFVIQINKNTKNSGVYSGSDISKANLIQNQEAIGAYLGFKLNKGEEITLKVGTSFSSIEAARANLLKEIPDYNYQQVLTKSKNIWEQELGKVKLVTKDEKRKEIFYTSLYHAMQQPRLYNDVNGTYPRFASDYVNEKLKSGDYYDDFSLWDTYRAQLPLFEILKPAVAENVANSLIIKGKEGGWLPIFPCWNSYTSEMIGDHCSSVIATTYLKGIGNINMDEAYKLMRQNAFDIPSSKADYIEGKGRRALDSYLKYGYIPVEDDVADAFHKKEQVSRTLEYAYDDYALALVAKKMGKNGDYQLLLNRSLNYKNVFDPTVKMVRGKHEDGKWVTPFERDKKEYYITEGTPRQYTFYVPHDVPGLYGIMGGRKELETALDSLFAKGEYWHGNEPGHQTPFMYNFTASPWKTQLEVHKILEGEYSNGPGGLGGNDDSGQMSAWYMFSSMGFYPLNPVSGEYILCAPAFDQVSLNLPSGKRFEIVVHKKTDKAIYINAVKLNGKPYNLNFIRYADIIKGGKLEYYLEETPNKNWGSTIQNQPNGVGR
ncbi:GH92 family glycosyl hydrolase [Pedobacter mucosus]|uniref:GH92 family glycosyl hydrolase n=1 Tax=Pedobacter mucosus TaxID=2895286 RepID=UPI001EE4ACF1|nr:GH92 family glycosyl hydrolase [Pedobacter mucosus]UKT64961.1 GH92 family glycosyl hydrolase [Pedobacter mucosus]